MGARCQFATARRQFGTGVFISFKQLSISLSVCLGTPLEFVFALDLEFFSQKRQIRTRSENWFQMPDFRDSFTAREVYEEMLDPSNDGDGTSSAEDKGAVPPAGTVGLDLVPPVTPTLPEHAYNLRIRSAIQQSVRFCEEF